MPCAPSLIGPAHATTNAALRTWHTAVLPTPWMDTTPLACLRGQFMPVGRYPVLIDTLPPPDWIRHGYCNRYDWIHRLLVLRGSAGSSTTDPPSPFAACRVGLPALAAAALYRCI